MMNLLLYGQLIIRRAVLPVPGEDLYHEKVQEILERRAARYMARIEAEQDDLQFPVLYEETVGEPG